MRCLETKPVPELTPEQIDAAFAAFTGEFEQMPPMVSAIKKDGVPLYKLARKGQDVERAPRPVRVDSFKITRIELPEIDFVRELLARVFTSAPTPTTSARSSAAAATSAPCAAPAPASSRWIAPSRWRT